MIWLKYVSDILMIWSRYTYHFPIIPIMIQIYPWYTVDIHIGLARLWYDSNMSQIWFRYGTDMVVRSYHLNHIGMIGKWYVYRNHIMSISDTYLNHINLYSGMQYGWGPKYVYLNHILAYQDHIRTISEPYLQIWSWYGLDMLQIWSWYVWYAFARLVLQDMFWICHRYT